ncbi:tetratricopeptide repeat protein [Thalassotalea montiporae]
MKLATYLLSSCLLSSAALATEVSNTFNDKLLAVQHAWAKANYEAQDKTQQAAFKQLSEQSLNLASEYPKKAESWIWHGIVQSSYANAKGGLGALSLIDDAKEAFELAIDLNDQALDGSAHTSLGILYLKVPGWPVSFGDDDEAEKHLKLAQQINPDGIDVNFFLAQYYIEQDKWPKAKEHLLLAQAAPKRAHRPLADKYRQQEVATLLTEVNKALD